MYLDQFWISVCVCVCVCVISVCVCVHVCVCVCIIGASIGLQYQAIGIHGV